MQVYVNGPLLRRRARGGLIYLLGATLCLVGGFLLSLVQSDLGAQYAVSLSSLILGLYLWSRNQAYLHRWGPRWRQDETLRRALRALDDRYHLLVAPGSSLPDYLLVGPMGVLVVIPRSVGGTVECLRDQWHHDDGRLLLVKVLLWFSPNPPLGNPTAEARRGVEMTRSYLAGRAWPEIEARLKVEALVVFTNPKLRLLHEGCRTSALMVRSLRGHLRRLPRALAVAEVTAVAEELTRDLGGS